MWAYEYFRIPKRIKIQNMQIDARRRGSWEMRRKVKACLERENWSLVSVTSAASLVWRITASGRCSYNSSRKAWGGEDESSTTGTQQSLWEAVSAAAGANSQEWECSEMTGFGWQHSGCSPRKGENMPNHLCTKTVSAVTHTAVF